MKKKTILVLSFAGVLCAASVGLVFAKGPSAIKYYVGEVVGLNAVDDTLTITEYNSGSPRKFNFSQIGLPDDIYIGDEVVVASAKDNEAAEIRLLAEKNRLPARGMKRVPGGVFAQVPAGAYMREGDPFYDIARLQEQMSRMLQDSFQAGNIDQGLFNSNLSFDKDFKLKDAGDEYVLKLDLTGLDKDNVKIEMDKNSITLKGQSEMEKQENGRNGSVRYRSFGTFMKTIPLPPDADTRSMDSKLDGDIMTIRMPKKAK